jgi:hypothetical protein
MSGHQRPNRGLTDDWLTPPELIKALGPFDLDPCASVGQPWRTAKTMWTKDFDGLIRPWWSDAFTWLNPPFGSEWPAWVERLADHGNGIALINARTETRPFHRLVWNRADAVFFFKGRLFFHRPITGERAEHNAGAPSVLVAYGSEAVRRLERLGMPGKFLKL